jgi:hypothetical protein
MVISAATMRPGRRLSQPTQKPAHLGEGRDLRQALEEVHTKEEQGGTKHTKVALRATAIL